MLLTDDHSRRVFGRYWLLIRPFSGLIRREWLAAIARRAREACPEGETVGDLRTGMRQP